MSVEQVKEIRKGFIRIPIFKEENPVNGKTYYSAEVTSVVRKEEGKTTTRLEQRDLRDAGIAILLAAEYIANAHRRARFEKEAEQENF